MKKFILFLLSLSFFVNQSFAQSVDASQNFCATTRHQDGVTLITGMKDGKNFSYKDHCYKDTNILFEYSCNGNDSKLTKTTCPNGCDKEARACKTSSDQTTTTVTNPTPQTTDLSLVLQNGSTLFEYSTVAQRLGMLNNFGILLNKVIALRTEALGEVQSVYINGFDGEIQNIQHNIQQIVSQKREILDFVEMLKREITLRNEQLDIVSEVKERLSGQFRGIQANADSISQNLYGIHSTINEEIRRIPITGNRSVLNEQLEFLEENDKLLNEKLKLLQELTLIKM